jgi:hypothetical protein
VALLFFHEKRESFRKVGVADSVGVGTAAILEAAALGAFAELELLDGRADDREFPGGELVMVGGVWDEILGTPRIGTEIGSPASGNGGG